MLENKLTKRYEEKIDKDVYEPRKNEVTELYGKIDIYSAEKTFASSVCCMCCK